MLSDLLVYDLFQAELLARLLESHLFVFFAKRLETLLELLLLSPKLSWVLGI